MANIIDDLRSKWSGMSDDQKQDALNLIGEMIGGTAGAIAGGPTPLAIAGAGAGSVAGNSAAHFMGKALGLKTTPKTAGETLKQEAGTLASGAIGEGVGRAIPVAYRGVKSLAGRAVRKAINPDPAIVAAAQRAGVELTPGMAAKAGSGGNPLPAIIENGLEQTIGGSGPIRNKTIKAVEQWENGSARKVPQTLRPTPASATEAGELSASQLAANRSASAAHYRPQYEAVNTAAGDAPIDFTMSRDEARAFLDGLPQGMESYFPGGALKKLKAVAGMVDGQRLPGNAMIDGPAPVMTFKEAQQLRTGLLEAERAMSHGDAAVQRRAIPALRNSIDTAIEDSLSNSQNPAHQQALQDWRSLNKSYGDTSRRLYSDGKNGNPVTSAIDAAKQPESIPPAIGRNPTAVQQAEDALTPMFNAPDTGAMTAVRRNAADDLLEGSRTQNRFVGDEWYINPRRLEKKLDENGDTYKALFGQGPYQELRDAAELGKAVTRPTQFQNTSYTAKYNHLLKYGTMVPGAVYGAVTGDDPVDRLKGAAEGMAAGVVIPRLAAKAWTGPMSRAVMGQAPKALSPLTRNVIQPILGASGRAIAEMEQMPERTPPKLGKPSNGDEFFLDNQQKKKDGDEFFAQ